ncbi:MAG TPA: ATP-binding protein [Candidatus Sulfotelmatobacter sp.]|jgi:two-component system, NtrC family, sensor histidine kinase HydH|nr:ATP-binding protein [Candidatus Sulfotelmatobacter sp.]
MSQPIRNEQSRSAINWMDFLWLVLLALLAILPPVREYHKQFILLGFGVLQLSEGWLIARLPRRGPVYIIVLKIALATLLLDHTGEIPINSYYYPIYYLPAVTAAQYFGPWATLFWTALASTAYCSYLYPALQEYEINAEDYGRLAIRIVFFFLAAMVVNRFVVENRRQIKRYQELAETLAETNRKLEQAQEEARRSERLAALGQMSAGLAHEIRNPLGVIKGSAEMLHQKLGESNPLASELAGYISSETNRLSALVTRFLDFARPLHVELTPLDITAVLDRALHSVSLSLGQAQKDGVVRVERQYEADLPLVPLDESLSEQAFANLIQNAYDAMSSSGGTLRVRAARANSANRDGVEVRIEDTGPGIPAELREQIFNPFVTTKKTGVGLGLSIVSTIVDGHHGTIRVEGGKDGSDQHGACFVVFFPEGDGTAAAQAS